MQSNEYFVTKINMYTQKDLMSINLVKKIENFENFGQRYNEKTLKHDS